MPSLLVSALVLSLLGIGTARAQPSALSPPPILWGPAPAAVDCGDADAANARLLALDDPAYRWIARLQRRGQLLSLNPTAFPYSEGEILRALARVDLADLSPLEQRWANRLCRRFSPRLRPADDTAALGLELAAGAAATNNDRLEPLRYTEAADPTFEAGDLNLYPNASLRASLAVGPVAAQFGMGYDQFYWDDPDGLRVVKELSLRNEEQWLALELPWLGVRLGNAGRQWGLPDGDGVLVSTNPRSYEAVSLRIGRGPIALRSLASELDAATLDGTFTGRTGNQSREPSIRRYLVAHRLDWRPRPWLTLAIAETMVSSGQGAPPQLATLVPTSIYTFLNDGPPKNNENNTILGGLIHLQHGRLALSGQLALDDFDLLRKGALPEPASIALTGEVTVSGLGADRFDSGLGLTLVTSRAYDTGLPEQSFLYAERGIGTQFSDFLHARAFADIYLDDLVEGLMLRPEAQWLVQGERDIRQPFPDNSVPLLFVGTPEQTIRLGTQIRLQSSPWWWLQADLGVNRTSDAAHVEGASATRFVGLVEGGARLRLGTRLRSDG